jgi:CotH kinase protein/Lamin Tail Domain/Chitobiase/beta-hexosaminidase C-terminal domain
MKTVLTALLSLSTLCSAQTIRIALHNGATTNHAMVPANTPTTQGSVVKTNVHTWNNVARNGGTVGGVTYPANGLNLAGFVLKDETGTDSLARLEIKNANGSSFANNGWGSNNKDYVMMEGVYHFSTTTGTTNSIHITNIPASLQAAGYTVAIYADIITARTMNYIVSDGGTPQTLTIAGTAANFTGTFTEGLNYDVTAPLSGSTVDITFDTALNTGGGVSVIGGIIIQPVQATINSFGANPPSVTPGGTVTLSWDSVGFQTYSISPGVGDVTAQTTNGAGSVNVVVNSPTTFTLTATGAGGAPIDTKNVSVSILPPTITSFTANPASISGGGTSTLSWQTSDATSVSIAPGPGNQAAVASGSVDVSPASSTLYTLTASNGQTSATAKRAVIVDGILLAPRISEFVAENKASLADGDGFFSDWIEIENLNDVAQDISGYFLTDAAGTLTKWTFPAGTVIPANSVLVVFASGKAVGNYVDAGGKLHTNFSLNKDGEFLALVAPNGTTIVQQFAPQFPKQYQDVSYSPEGFYATPTPGAPNSGPTLEGIVADTVFSIKRGFFSAPFNVAITCATPLSSIYYTTNGTAPTPANGTLYSAPIAISTTTTLRAAAFRTGWRETDVDTNTYIFTSSVIAQNNTPPGYPAQWAGRTADYEMDPEIINHPAYAGQFDAALKALPTLSVVMDPDDMFGAQGLYQNPTSEGDAWERPASAEWISPDGSEPGFRINCGIRIQGASSRNPDTPKHSMSLRFRSAYGAGKLKYDIFRDETAVEEFDLLQLRPEYNHGFVHRHYYQCDIAQYNRDQWTSDLFKKMGNRGSHGRWSHLYINGIYWGLYDVQERPDQDFMASYFGGAPEEYDVLNSGVATNGDTVAYNAMFTAAAGNIADDAVYQTVLGYLDVDPFIDYMLLNFYIGNRDWDGHNWRAGRKRDASGRFYFFPWDSEFAISNNNAGVINSPAAISAALTTDVTGRNGSGNPSGLHQRLALNAEYRLRFADRVRRHMLDGGALTPSAVAATWQERSPLIDASIIAESARWGDFRRDVDPAGWTSGQFALYTKNDHYLPTQAYIVGTYFPQRTATVMSQLTTRALYPSVAAPVLSQHGGSIAPPYALTITAPDVVRYTLDGTDPRLVGGSVAPGALTYTPGSSPAISLGGSTLIKARTLSGGVWSALTEANFSASDLRITEIMYHPAGDGLAEFLEITNTGAATVSLAGMHFTQGIDFAFDTSSIQTLAAGERLLIVRDLAAFQAVHGNAHDARIAGAFQNGTALNDGGETLTLTDSTGGTVLSFSYNNNAPWPSGADGAGYSLVFVTGNPSNPASWRHSTLPGGNPNATDSVAYTSGSVLNYYLAAAPALDPTTRHLTIVRRANADSASHVVESATTLQQAVWPTDEVTLLSVTPDGHGNEILIYQTPAGLTYFFRARVTVP